MDTKLTFSNYYKDKWYGGVVVKGVQNNRQINKTDQNWLKLIRKSQWERFLTSSVGEPNCDFLFYFLYFFYVKTLCRN